MIGERGDAWRPFDVTRPGRIDVCGDDHLEDGELAEFGAAAKRLRERVAAYADAEIECEECGRPMPLGRLLHAGYTICGRCNTQIYSGRVEIGLARMRGRRVLER
jgi:hypothetical protein